MHISNKMPNAEQNQKIVYFLDFPYDVGGSNKVLLTQAYIMRKKGYDILVVIPNEEDGGHSSAYDEICERYELNVTMAVYPVSTNTENIDIGAVIKCFDAIMRLLIEEKADLVHSAQINIAVEMAARELGIPHLMNIYQIDKEAFGIKWLDIFPHYHSADSEMFSERWGAGLHIHSECIRVAYEKNGGKAKERLILKSSKQMLRLLSIGILAERKNQLEVIKAVLLCKRSGLQVVLTILGDDNTPYGMKCKEYVKQNNLDEEVKFCGFVLNVEEYYLQADVMVLSSTVESYPGVVVESMANRVPVLATPVAGIVELLQDGYNGFLTAGYCSEDIYEALQYYMRMRENGNIQNIIDSAYNTYLQNHSYEAVGTYLERYYNWIWQNHDKDYSRVHMQDVKKIFENFICEKGLRGMNQHTQRNGWFLYHINKIINRNMTRTIAIWGAGYFGRIALEWLDVLGCTDKMVGYIDTYRKGEYLGYPILNDLEQEIKTCDVVLVAIGDVNERLKVMKHLEKFGKSRNFDYFMMLNDPIRI